MDMETTAWDALQEFMQRNEFLIDREYVNACRHYAGTYERDSAFEVWQSALNRYLPYVQEGDRMTGCPEDRLGLTRALTDDCIRASLLRMAGRIPVYAMLRTGRVKEAPALLSFLSGRRMQEAPISESV